MLKKIADGILAGIMVSIGGTVFLSCVKDGNKFYGAVFFSIALLCICFKGYSLFTGKVGYIAEKCGKEELSVLFLGLLGNAIGTCFVGFAIAYAVPGLSDIANVLCSAKLEQEFFQTLIRAIFCGILMYLAVSIYRENKSVLGIFLCVPVFILSGFEHSIANMFYFGASGIVSLKAFLYLMLVVLGNSVGGMLFPLIKKIGAKESTNA